ncbi:MAG: 2-succinyl-6-hydroxy-2,4-cyclohexadiene-1-carboxylate synthase [bacterium]
MKLQTKLINTLFDGIDWNCIIPEQKKDNSKPIIFLHGFAGNANDWIFLFDKLYSKNYYPIFLDILGHGLSSSPDDISFYTEEKLVLQLNSVINKLTKSKIILAGYSLGGRLALSYASNYLNNIDTLILESTTAGISDKILQQERLKNDIKIAEKIKNNNLEDFFNYWYNLPLFSSLQNLPAKDFTDLINKRKINSAIGLSNIMVGFSQGVMLPKWDLLKCINIKTLLLSGRLDIKFTELNKKMNLLIQNSVHKSIINSGHIPHLENTSLFGNYLLNFLEP